MINFECSYQKSIEEVHSYPVLLGPWKLWMQSFWKFVKILQICVITTNEDFVSISMWQTTTQGYQTTICLNNVTTWILQINW